jgi:hypothetical protein
MFEKGQAKIGGRKKGSKNRKPTKTLRQALADLDFDLGKALTDFLKTDLDSGSRLKALELIARYTQVVPRADEVPPDDDDEIDASEAELTEALDNNVHSINPQ